MNELELNIATARLILDAAPMGPYPHYCRVNGVLVRQSEPDGEVEVLEEKADG